MLNLAVSSILCFFTSNTSSNDPVFFHLLLLLPVEIPKIKTDLIFITVFNVLHFGLRGFIQLTVMSLLGQLKNQNITQKVCFLYCGVLCALRLLVILQNTKNNSPGVGMFFLVNLETVIFSENLDDINHLRSRFHL